MRYNMRLALGVCLAVLLGAVAAQAQYKQYPVSQPATGERYHVEGSIGLWNPTPTLLVSSESLGIVGSTVDAVADLGMERSSFPEFRLVLRPAKKHKFRFQYMPISFEAEQPRLQRDIVFNGIKYSVGVPVNSSLKWDAYRFTYEYDFLYKDRWFVGFIAEAKYTDVRVDLSSPVLPDPDWAEARAPIPALGGICRFYPLNNVSVTTEVTAFKMPAKVGRTADYDGRYIDIDIYGTFNITNNFGVQGGWRSLDLNYTAEEDRGDMTLKGLYFMGVARF